MNMTILIVFIICAVGLYEIVDRVLDYGIKVKELEFEKERISKENSGPWKKNNKEE